VKTGRAPLSFPTFSEDIIVGRIDICYNFLIMIKNRNRTKNEFRFDNLIKLSQNSNFPHIYDVEILHLQEMKRYASVECHLVLYPYSRRITSDHIMFNPYEEYVDDINARQKSAYIKWSNHFSNVFGLVLAVVVTAFLLLLKIDNMYTVESIVSILGVYFVGKSLWVDIEKFLVNLTQNWRIRYQQSYYHYQMQKNTTLSFYSHLAKKRRYGITSLLPSQMDFIEQSNSKTIQMSFDKSDFKKAEEDSAHILSIHLVPSLLEELKKRGYMFGVKLSFNKRFLGITRSYELFQSIEKGTRGCLNGTGDWIDGAVFYRRTLSLMRLKYFRKSGTHHNRTIIWSE
jgi:hypothetical protein